MPQLAIDRPPVGRGDAIEDTQGRGNATLNGAGLVQCLEPHRAQRRFVVFGCRPP